MSTEFINGKWVKGTPSYQVKKNVRLTPGAIAEDIVAIEGKIVMRLPTRVVKTRLDIPFAGQILESEGVRVVLGESKNAGELNYEISGDFDRILA